MTKRFTKYNKYTKTFKVITYDENKLYNYAINRLSVRDYGRQELFNKMKRFQDDETLINKILDKLESLKYLSDERRIISLLNQYERQESINKTKNRIIQLGISKDLLDNVLQEREENLNFSNNFNNDEVFNLTDNNPEVYKALQLLIKKYKIYNKDNWDKMLRYLISKGFKYDSTKKAIKIFSDEDNTQMLDNYY